MQIQGQQLILADRARVWAALNDPAVLQRCLPGCESVEQSDPQHFKVTVRVAIGPLRARFLGKLSLANVRAPEACTMHFEGQGGATGFGQGSAQVELHSVAQGTELRYSASVQVGGKLAQIGSRLIESVARKMTDDFFQAFQNALNPAAEKAAPSPAAPSASTEAPAHTQAQGAAPASARERAHDAASADATPLVPAWWLAPAALLGGLLVILGAHYLR